MKKNIIFIINPIAGNGKNRSAAQVIDKHIDRNIFDYSIAFTEKKGDGTSMAREAALNGADMAVAVGGDGTVNEVASGLAGTSCALGIIPCGSGNGLSRHLGIPMNRISAVKSLNTGKIMEMDHCTLDGRPFFCTCGVGFDALVSMKFSASGRRGALTYIEKALAEWLKYKPVEYELETDEGVKMKQKAMLITCANANQWGNEARIAPHASLCDGMMDVTIIEPFTAVEVGPLALHLMSGTMNWSPRTKIFRCRRLHIRRCEDGPAHYDGDPVILGRELDIELIPAGVKVVVPARKKKI